MIDKVANERNPQWAQPQDDSFARDSVSKSAMDAFTLQLAMKAKDASSRGFTPEHIAASMKLPVDMVLDLLTTHIPKQKEREARLTEVMNGAKFAAKQEKEAAKSYEQQKEDHLSAAELAYYQLHGNKKAETALKEPAFKSSKSLAPSRKGDVGEMGGPKKYMQYNSANSIWDAEVLQRNLAKKGNDERIREENQIIAERRAQLRKGQCHIDKDAFLEALEQTETRKDNSAYGYHAIEAHNYSGKLQKRGISIFDNLSKSDELGAEGTFHRIASKTAGEEVSESRRKERSAKKDRSWAVQSAPKNTRTMFDQMVDSFLEGQE
jgi:hypothetical protein